MATADNARKLAANNRTGPFGKRPQTNPAMLAAMNDVYGHVMTAKFATFDVTTTAGRVLEDRCAEEPDAAIKDLGEMKFALAHVYSNWITVPGPSEGEVRQVLRTCLISDKGEVIATTSMGIAQSVARIVGQEGVVPFPRRADHSQGATVALENDRLYFVNDPDAVGKAGES